MTRLRVSSFTIYGLLSLWFFACQAPKKQNLKPILLATTGMIGDAIGNIVDTSFEVRSMMGAGVDPHFFKPTQKDVKLISQADVIFHNGLHLEGKMSDIFESLKKRRPHSVFAVSETIPKEKLIQLMKSIYDPHIWFSIPLWKYAVEKIYQELALKYPHKKEVFRLNFETYVGTLNQLDSSIRKDLDQIPEKQRVLVTSHDAFAYFSQEYGMKNLSIQGISTLSDYSLKDLEDISDTAIFYNVKAFFVETSVNPRGIKSLIQNCQSKGHEVKIGGKLFSDALGDTKTPEGTYIGAFRHNVKQISEGLK